MAVRRQSLGLWVALGCFCLCREVVAAPPLTTNPADEARHFAEQVRPLLARHCVECHRGDQPKGKLRLDNLTPDFAEAVTREHWSAVVKRVQAGEMPPKDKPRPTAKKRGKLWSAGTLTFCFAI